MKRLLLVFSIIILSNVLFAQTEKRVIELSGKIANKYPIKMILTIKDNNVLGYYFYTKYKTKILLEGTIKNNKIELTESPDYEDQFKKGFVGKIDYKGFEGEWKDIWKEKSLNFKSQIISDKTITIDESAKKIEGHYKNVNNSDAYHAALYLVHIKDNIFCFEFSVGTESGCVGYLKQLVVFSNSEEAYYRDNNCEKIEFRFDSEHLIIKEENCDWHGYNCYFEGKYKKN